MQILTIRKGFEAFDRKLEPFETDLSHLNANSNHSKRIWSIRMQIRMQIRIIPIIRKGFEAFEHKF